MGAAMAAEWVRCLAFAVLLLDAAPAHAEDPGAYRLEYRAPAGCPDSAAFANRIRGHTGLARPALEGEPARGFSVEIMIEQDAPRGRLVVRELNGTESSREVPGRDCTEVAWALALVAAIVIDPNAALVINPNAATLPASEPAHSPTPERLPNAPQTVDVRPPPPRAVSWRLGLGAQAGIVTKNVAPETPMPIVAIHVELVRDGGGLFAPELRLAGYRAWRDGVPNPVGTADFEWLSARLSACPVRWPIEGRLALRPCALFDLGELVARGHDNEGGGEQHRVLWTALGGAVRGEALAWDPIVLEIEAAGIGPLHRDRFYFDPNVTVHRVGVGFQAAVGAGVRFP